MRKLWLVARYEYLKRVKERSFLVAVLGIPLMIVAVSGISILVALGGADDRPLGYVDHASILNREVLPALQQEGLRPTEMLAYTDEGTARAALEAGEIQAYYVLPPDYLSSKQAELFYGEDAPQDTVQGDFEAFVRASLVSQASPEVQPRLSEGFSLVIRSRDGRRELDQGNIISILLPFVTTFFLFFAIATAGGYLLQAVTDEKENRTIEIIATSVSPEQVMGGKALGLMGVSLTQILVWVTTLVVGLVVATQFWDVLGTPSVPWALLLIVILYFLPTFTLIAGIMTTIGAAVTELQQGQQVSGILNMLFILPVFFIAPLISNPDSPLLVILTLFPTTAFLTTLLRWSLAAIPLWQMVVSWVILTSSALVSVWVAGRVFRMGMLRYGQRLRLRTIVQGLVHRQVALEREANGHA